MVDRDHFGECSRVVSGVARPELHGAFCAYLEGIHPRPSAMHLIVGISPGDVSRRKEKFMGHVGGYHPALVWHFYNFLNQPETLPPHLAYKQP